MKNRFYTFIIIPEKSTKVRKIVIPRVTLQLIGIFATILIFVLGIILTDYSSLLNKVLQSQKISEQNQTLKLNYDKLQNRLSSIENAMDRMKTFATKLRTITNLPTTDPNIPVLKTDRPNDDDLDPITKGAFNKMADLEETSLSQESYLQRTYELVQDKSSILARTPSILPAKGWVASTFGYRYHPIYGKWTMHEGLDIASYSGTQVIATADGIVSYVGMRGGFGKIVVIDHGYGIKTLYAHNSNILVKVGDIIKRGQKIASMGASGAATGTHVHYEVRINDVPVDPVNYILTEDNFRTITATTIME